MTKNWDGLFDSFEEETISNGDYFLNYDSVGKLYNKTDHDSQIIFDQYFNISDVKVIE